MKTLLLAAVATAALALPAIAQTQTTPAPAPAQSAPADQATQAQSGMQDGMQNIDPKTLDRQQVEDVQRALDKMSFGAGRIDGVWGPETAAALEKFQKAKDLSLAANGEINGATLSALQLDPNKFGMAGMNANTSGANANTMASPNSDNANGTNNSANGPAQANGSNKPSDNAPTPPPKTP